MQLSARPAVLAFGMAMEAKLRVNDHKGHWANSDGQDFDWFMQKLKGEIEELEEALISGNEMDVLEEAADIGNFAMMIADIVIRRVANYDISHAMERAEAEGLPRSLCPKG